MEDTKNVIHAAIDGVLLDKESNFELRVKVGNWYGRKQVKATLTKSFTLALPETKQNKY